MPISLSDAERSRFPLCPTSVPLRLVESRLNDYGLTVEQVESANGLGPRELYSLINGIGMGIVNGLSLDVVIGFLQVYLSTH